jgi:hypothetical protein
MDELARPIHTVDLDVGTLRRLYESKAVYLENLRVKCFMEINTNPSSPYSQEDYRYILKAIEETRGHIRGLILNAINHNLSQRRKVS